MVPPQGVSDKEPVADILIEPTHVLLSTEALPGDRRTQDKGSVHANSSFSIHPLDCFQQMLLKQESVPRKRMKTSRVTLQELE